MTTHHPSPASGDNIAVIPSIQDADFSKLWWMQRHREKIDLIARQDFDPQLVFIGDSITHAWEELGCDVWQQHYARYDALNLGFAGDRTEHVLWRLLNGELDGLSPRLVVMQIGTNNAGHRKEPAGHTAAGIRRILEILQQRLPDARILLLAIFPRGRTAGDPLRQLTQQINRAISQFADGKQIHFLDIGEHFVDANGVIARHIMGDYLHPEASQYAVWADAMHTSLTRLMQPD